MSIRKGDYGAVVLFGIYDDDDEGGAIVYLRGMPGSDDAITVTLPRRLLIKLPMVYDPGDETPTNPEGTRS